MLKYIIQPVIKYVFYCQHNVSVGARGTKWGKTSNRKIMDIYQTAAFSPEAATNSVKKGVLKFL